MATSHTTRTKPSQQPPTPTPSTRAWRPQLQRPSHPETILQQAASDHGALSTTAMARLQQSLGHQAVTQLLADLRSRDTAAGTRGGSTRSMVLQRVRDAQEQRIDGLLASLQTEHAVPPPIPQPEWTGHEADQQDDREARREVEPGRPSSRVLAAQNQPVQRQYARQKPNPTGLPDDLKTGLETLSGLSMDDVKVHYSSSKPVQLHALAYTQGANIHMGPRQRQHLAHEAWHVVQQKQGRVKPTLQVKGVAINDDERLEKEAEVMGAKALQIQRPVQAAATEMPLKSATAPQWVGKTAEASAVQDETIKASREKMRLNFLSPDEKQVIQRVEGLKKGAKVKVHNGKATNSIFSGTILEVRENGYYKVQNDSTEESEWWLEEVVYPEEWTDGKINAENKEQVETAIEREQSANKKPIETAIEREQSEKYSSELESKQPDSEEGDEDPHATFKAEAKAGLELTFSSKDSKKYVTNTGFPIAEKTAAKSWWDTMLKSWTRGIQAPDDWEVNVKQADKNKDLGNRTGDMRMCRMVYTDPDNDEVFWWQLSMDPGVIEIQTCPVTGEEMEDGPIRQIIENIYQRAADLGFKAGGGGGHVNVDFKTGFGEDYSLIPKIISVTE